MKSEFEKKMDLLDPGYVAPMSERVANRQPIAIKAETLPIKNEAGLPILPDRPVDDAMQRLYLDRMMQKEAVDKLQNDDRKFYTSPNKAQALTDLGVHMRGGIPELNEKEEAELEQALSLEMSKLNPRQRLFIEAFVDKEPGISMEEIAKQRGK